MTDCTWSAPCAPARPSRAPPALATARRPPVCSTSPTSTRLARRAAAARRAPAGLVGSPTWTRRQDAVLEDLARRVSPRVLAAPRKLDQPRRELDEYFAGRRDHFDAGSRPAADDRLWPAGAGGDRAIPFGSVSSYKRGRHRGRQPARLPRGRQRAGREPDPDHPPLPPGRPLGRRAGRLHRWPGAQARSAWHRDRPSGSAGRVMEAAAH